MDTFVQQTLNGLTLGAVYALIALGYSMVYGVLKLLNFAHGDVYMVGAFIGFGMIQWLGFRGADDAWAPVISTWFVLFGRPRRRDGRARRCSASRSSASPTGRCATRPASRR